MNAFVMDILPVRVVFANDALLQLHDELEVAGGKRAIVISTPGQGGLANQIQGLLGHLCVGVYAKAVQHVPMATVVEAVETVSKLDADSLIAVGGGSSIGLAKAIALQMGLSILAIPTTYSGSEMTSVWGITEHGMKTTGKNRMVKPITVIYDPQLTLSLPVSVSVTSAMNAIAHCVEGLYAESVNPLISLMAEDGIRALCASMPLIVENAGDLDARGTALYGAWQAGTVLGSVGMALHHKLCHVLGGSYHLPHAETHAVMLPHVTAYNSAYAPEAMQGILRAMRSSSLDAAGALYDFTVSLGAPVSLHSLGMKESDLDAVVSQVTQNPYYNPGPIDPKRIRALLQRAYEGIRPNHDEENASRVTKNNH